MMWGGAAADEKPLEPDKNLPREDLRLDKPDSVGGYGEELAEDEVAGGSCTNRVFAAKPSARPERWDANDELGYAASAPKTDTAASGPVLAPSHCSSCESFGGTYNVYV